MIRVLQFLSLFTATALIAACSSTPQVVLADESLMPDRVMEQAVDVQEAYRFALAMPEHLEDVPCYCGCVGIGHRNNADCYFKPGSTLEAPIFDEHALFCVVCVDITQVVMDMVDSSASPIVIRSMVESRFGEMGPSTDEPMPNMNITGESPLRSDPMDGMDDMSN